MKHIHEQLNHPAFIRVHKSSVVNINKITAIEGNELKLGKHKIQMSKENRPEILNKIKIIK